MLRLEQFHADKAIVEALLEDEAAPGLADAILTRAALLDCDPLAVIVHQTRRDQDVIYRRAAALFGLRFVCLGISEDISMQRISIKNRTDI